MYTHTRITHNNWLRVFVRNWTKNKPQKRTACPVKLNQKAYWWSERRPYKRTIVTFLKTHNECKIFGTIFNNFKIFEYKKENELYNDTHLYAHTNATLATQLINILTLPGPYTVFAPSDVAFRRMDPDVLEALKINTNAREAFIKNHIFEGFWLLRDLVGSSYQPWLEEDVPRKAPEHLMALNRHHINIKTEGSLQTFDRKVYIHKSEITRFDCRCHNGVVHVIDRPIEV